MIVHHFRPIPFHTFDCELDKEEYYGLCSYMEGSGAMEVDENGILTDYHTQEKNFDKGEVVVWHNYVIKHCGKQLQEFIKDEKAEDVLLKAVWTQQTNGKIFHGPHTHGDCNHFKNWSFVLYVDIDPEVHEPTEYYNFEFGETFKAEPIPGKLIIWPSHIVHMQPASNSELTRSIISGNMELVK